jgi:hypothetical protein
MSRTSGSARQRKLEAKRRVSEKICVMEAITLEDLEGQL